MIIFVCAAGDKKPQEIKIKPLKHPKPVCREGWRRFARDKSQFACFYRGERSVVEHKNPTFQEMKSGILTICV